MKTCTKCKIEKSLTEFSKGNCKKDGRAYWCNLILGYAERYGLCRDSADIDLYLVKYNV